MKLARLVTYRFAPNVGPRDRAFRIVSGFLMTIFPWIGVALPLWFSLLLSAFGLLWIMTGIVSRCGMYFLLGLSTAKRQSLSNDTDVEKMRFKDKNDG